MSEVKYVIKRSGAKVPFKFERIMNAIYRAADAVGGRDKERAEYLAKKVVEHIDNTHTAENPPTIEEIQDAVEKILIEEGHAKVSKAFILYRDERNRKRKEDAEHASVPSENIPWAKIWYLYDWAVSKNLHTIEHLNKRVSNGEFPHIVHESEAKYEDDVTQAVDMIKNRLIDLKVVMISGPSSSGKTTTTLKLEQRLSELGLKFKPWIVDNYFFDLELHPKDEFGDYDFETPQALDLDLINDHLKLLTEGKEVLIPFYDFKTGTRKLNQTPLKLEKNELLLIDSLHGLYPQFSHSIPEEQKFKLYLEPLLQMKDKYGNFVQWTDLRLIRRMLRDSAFRAYKPQQTLEHWHYVRASELRNIIPYNNTADYIISSGMPYELCLYANRLTDNFAEWNEKYKDDPLKVDAFNRAARIYQMLTQVEPVANENPIPGDSVLREFIGGSTLKY